MASINDVINANLARVMANHGAPLRALAAREDANENDARRRDAEARSFNDKVKLLNLEDQATTARGLQLLNARNKFDAGENEKSRQSRLKEIEQQARAYVDRLTSTDKQKELARLRALGIEIKGDSIDDQLADGLKKQASGDYPKARGALGIYKDYERKVADLDSEIAQAEKADAEYISKTADLIARTSAAEMVKATLGENEIKALGGKVTPEAILGASGLTKKRKEELLGALESTVASQRAQNEVALTSDKLSRPTQDKLKSLRNEKLKTEGLFFQFQNSEPGRLAMDRLTFERDGMPAPIGASSKKPAGLETVMGIMSTLNKGGDIKAAMGERQAMDSTVKDSFTAPPTATSRDLLPRAPGEGVPSEFLNALIDPVNSAARSAGSTMAGFGRSVADAAQQITAPARSYIFGPDTSPLPMPQRPAGGGLNPTYGTMSAEERDMVSRLFGADAPDLLPEAAKLATSNGISEQDQLNTYRAALSGDEDSFEKMNTMLDFVRQARQSPEFVPLMPMPGVNAPAGNFPTPAPGSVPPRLFIGPR